MITFEIYQVKRGQFKGQWRFRLRAANGEIVATSESYHNKADALAAIALIKGSAAAPVVEK